jgi:uncharacterized protein
MMKPNRIALITGASSGIGKEFARRFAQSGYDLIITGRRKDMLTLLANQLEKGFGVSVTIITAELSDEKDINTLIQVIANNDNISVLVNNAGFGSGREFCKCDLACHMQMLQVHVITTLKLVHAVLPQMIRKRSGTIINVSSLAAFMPAPGSSIYSATKLFLKSFTESLHMEVSQYGIRIQCLCPGFTSTDFHKRRSAGNAPGPGRLIHWMNPETVVRKCLESLEKGKIVYVPGLTNRLLFRIVPLIPRFLYYNLMMKIAKNKNEDKPTIPRKSGKIQPAF